MDFPQRKTSFLRSVFQNGVLIFGRHCEPKSQGFHKRSVAPSAIGCFFFPPLSLFLLPSGGWCTVRSLHYDFEVVTSSDEGCYFVGLHSRLRLHQSPWLQALKSICPSLKI